MADEIKGCEDCTPVIVYNSYRHLLKYDYAYEDVAKSIINSVAEVTADGKTLVPNFDLETGEGITKVNGNSVHCGICKNSFLSHHYSFLLLNPNEIAPTNGKDD